MDSDGLLPDRALTWRFSRSSGPGGQGVNTTDSRVELVVDVTLLPEAERLVERLGAVLHVTASEHRSQLRNREAARARALERIERALRPDPPSRRARRPSRGAKLRRLEDKRRRSDRKALRRAPSD